MTINDLAKHLDQHNIKTIKVNILADYSGNKVNSGPDERKVILQDEDGNHIVTITL